MSDTKHTRSGAVGRQYHLAVVEKKDKEIAALRAAAEKAMEALKVAHSFFGKFTADDCPDSVAVPTQYALAALEEVLK